MKKGCYKLLKQRVEFKATFATLGDAMELREEMSLTLERCVVAYVAIRNDFRSVTANGVMTK